MRHIDRETARIGPRRRWAIVLASIGGALMLVAVGGLLGLGPLSTHALVTPWLLQGLV